MRGFWNRRSETKGSPRCDGAEKSDERQRQRKRKREGREKEEQRTKASSSSSSSLLLLSRVLEAVRSDRGWTWR